MKQVHDLYHLRIPDIQIHRLALVLDIHNRDVQSRILWCVKEFRQGICLDSNEIAYIRTYKAYKHNFVFSSLDVLLQIQHSHSGKLAFVRLEFNPNDMRHISYELDGYFTALLDMSFEKILISARCTKLVMQCGGYQKCLRVNMPYTELLHTDSHFDFQEGKLA